MPTRDYTSVCDDPRWRKAMDIVRAEMLAAGWIERSGKFAEVRRRKAIKRMRLL